MKSYFTEPPQPNRVWGNLPQFIFKRRDNYRPATRVIDSEYMISLIRWAEQEFEDARAYAMMNNPEKLSALAKLNFIYLLARTKEFRMIVELMTEDIWKTVPNSVRKILAMAKREYDTLQ